MAYHLTIVRTRDGTPVPITREETAAAVAARGGLATKDLPKGRWEIRAAGPGDVRSVLVWDDGEIWSRDPRPETIALMLELAARLGARVRGDEFETYRTPDDTYEHPDDAAAIAAARAETRRLRRRSRLRQWSFHAAVATVFIVLMVVAATCSKR